MLNHSHLHITNIVIGHNNAFCKIVLLKKFIYSPYLKKGGVYERGSDGDGSNTGLKPSKILAEKMKQDAIRIPVKDGKVILVQKNPTNPKLMEENDES